MLHPIRETAHFTKWTYFCPFRELASSFAHFTKWARITLTLAHFMNWTLKEINNMNQCFPQYKCAMYIPCSATNLMYTLVESIVLSTTMIMIHLA